jgi:hypothetical protein
LSSQPHVLEAGSQKAPAGLLAQSAATPHPQTPLAATQVAPFLPSPAQSTSDPQPQVCVEAPQAAPSPLPTQSALDAQPQV